MSEESISSIEKMIRKLLQEQKEDTKQLLQDQKDDTKRVIECAIAQHVQHLNTAIAQERTSRVHVISDIQTQISELRKELCAFIAEPGQRVREGRSDEVSIGGLE